MKCNRKNDNRFWALVLTMDTSPINIFCPRPKHHNKEKLQIKDYFSSLRQCFTYKEIDPLFRKVCIQANCRWSVYFTAVLFTLVFPAVFRSSCLLGLSFRFYWLCSLVAVYRRLLVKDDIENALTEKKINCLGRTNSE